jgi:hypothetical protein
MRRRWRPRGEGRERGEGISCSCRLSPPPPSFRSFHAFLLPSLISIASPTSSLPSCLHPTPHITLSIAFQPITIPTPSLLFPYLSCSYHGLYTHFLSPFPSLYPLLFCLLLSSILPLLLQLLSASVFFVPRLAWARAVSPYPRCTFITSTSWLSLLSQEASGNTSLSLCSLTGVKETACVCAHSMSGSSHEASSSYYYEI